MNQSIGSSACKSDWPRVSVIVVNYNGGKHVARCLESLITDSYPTREIIVVDNGSTDDSRTILNSITMDHPDVTVLWSRKNLGYAGGINLALGSSHGEFIAALNMDMIVSTDWLKPLVRFLEGNPAVGAVNPLIALFDGKHVNAAGQDLHITGLGFNRRLGLGVESIGRIPFPVSGIQGGAFLIHRGLLEKMGGMDTTGFLYHEDVNLSWLLRLMGFDLYCVPESVVYHDYFLTMYPSKLYLLERNRWAMLLACLHWFSLLLLLPALLFTESLLWGYCLLRGSEFMRAKVSSYRWVRLRWPQIKQRRRFVKSLRSVSDWKLLRNLRWGYAMDQVVALGREQGNSQRQPGGGLPTESVND